MAAGIVIFMSGLSLHALKRIAVPLARASTLNFYCETSEKGLCKSEKTGPLKF